MMKPFWANILLLVLLGASFSGCADFADVLGGQIQTAQGVSPAKTQRVRTKPPIADKQSPQSRGKEAERFIWPVDGRMTSGFGPRRQRDHDGIDIVALKGAPVGAARSGSVLYSGKMSGYGNLIILKHPGNFFTAYGHLLESSVRKGQKVKQGERIGKVGRTGRASTTHLHFEIRRETKAVDPMEYLPPLLQRR